MATHIQRHLFGQAIAFVIHGQDDALNFEGRIETATHQIDRAHQLAKAFQRKELTLQGHQNRIGRRHGVDGQEIQRRRAINQYIGIAIRARIGAQGRESIAQLEGATSDLSQFHLNARQIGIRRHKMQAGQGGFNSGLQDGSLAQQDVIDGCGPLLARYAKARRGIALRIKVEDQHALADSGQGGTKIDRRRCLADAALLVGDRQNAQGRDGTIGHDRASLSRRCGHEDRFGSETVWLGRSSL